MKSLKITFPKQDDKDMAFYELVQGGFTITGVDVNVICVSKEACKMLDSKNIKYKTV